eukprot:scaffold47285_cov57-Phaeocystis_antarctica.AAC.2
MCGLRARAGGGRRAEVVWRRRPAHLEPARARATKGQLGVPLQRDPAHVDPFQIEIWPWAGPGGKQVNEKDR